MITLRPFHLIPLLIIVLVVGCGKDHPPDRAMEEKFKSYQSDFNRLAEMLNEDSDVVRLGHDFVFFDKGRDREIPRERMNEYRRLFEKLDLQNGVHRDAGNAIRLIASSNDGLFSKSEKSYVYSTEDLTPQVDSLDYVIKTDKGDHSPVYKKITHNWYLFYESW
jgi:hypothetical protein